jgi:CubicO group peptidase (beta-lactamase class C family)
MQGMSVKASGRDFRDVHAALRRYVDGEILAGVSHAVLQGRDVVDAGCAGWANREERTPLSTGHLFRIFSNTKLVTSCALLLLFEEGRFRLDDPIERYIPQLGKRRVLRAGATSLDDTEPAAGPMTIRHLMSHSAGLSYGLLDPGTLIFKAYNERKLFNPALTPAAMVEVLAELPLVFHPGTSWEYSIATDVLGHLVEILGGQRLDRFMQSRIFDPLGMEDTAFFVPETKQHRLTAYYKGADALDPMKPGLARLDDAPYRGAYLRPVPRLSGGGGLVSSLPDMVALLRSLLPGGAMLLKPPTIALMMANQLPSGINLRLPYFGAVPGKAHGLAGAVTVASPSFDGASLEGDLEWGGLAGTHWWISPKANLSGVLMTQRFMAFWHPFAFEFKRLVHRAAA